MPVFEDWLRDPLSIINNIFANDRAHFDQKVNEYFEAKLRNEKNYNSIPCLNDVAVHELPPNCLVRYRGMIQDSFDPVYFSSWQTMRHKKTGHVCQMTLKYKEMLTEGVASESDDQYEPCNDDDDINEQQQQLQQRLTFYCIPVPGESEWVRNCYKSNYSQELSCNMVGSTSSNLYRPIKRGLESATNVELVGQSSDEVRCEEGCDQSGVCVNGENGSSSESTKKTKLSDTPRQPTSPSPHAGGQLTLNGKYNFNCPLSGDYYSNSASPCAAQGNIELPCLVKVYDNYEHLRLNEMYEFVGILSQDPSLAYMEDEHGDRCCLDSQQQLANEHQQQQQDEHAKIAIENLNISKENDDEKSSFGKTLVNNNSSTTTSAQHVSAFPPSLVPRLHCIKFCSLVNDNPLLRLQNNEERKTSDTIESIGVMSAADESKYWSRQQRAFFSSLIANPIDSTNTNGSSSSSCDTNTDQTSGDQTAALLDSAQVYLIKLRKEIVSFLQELLLGDTLAAEYVLMHLLSSVFMRMDVTVLGKFTLNLTNIPASNKPDETDNFAACFYRAFRQLLTMSHLFRLSVDTLNKSNLIPNKDYNKDRLLTGMLQLPSGFQLLVDETVLSSGELSQKGLLNVNALTDVIRWQKINYDFGFNQHEFLTNVRLLVLSQTKSILPFDCQLKMQANVDRFNGDKYEAHVNSLLSAMGSSLLTNMRKYLTILAKIDYKLSPSMQKCVEEDIVQIRQNHLASGVSVNKKEKMSVEDLHLLLVVARLQTLSYGKSELGLNEWNKAKALEVERLNNRV